MKVSSFHSMGSDRVLHFGAVRGEEVEGLRFRHEVHVEADHRIGLGVLAFEAQPPEQAARILGGDPGEIAAAGRLEALLDGLGGAVFPGERAVGVDGERRLGLRLGETGGEPERNEGEKQSA